MFELRAFVESDAAWVLKEHASHYAESDGFDGSFADLVAERLAEFARQPDAGRAWVAHGAGERVGCIFLGFEDTGTARLRLFYVTSAQRGQGLGRRLLGTAIGIARDRGCARVRVWTHESHRAAGRLYAGFGFTRTQSRPVRRFGRSLIEECWELGLDAPDPPSG